MGWKNETTRDDGLFIERTLDSWTIFYRDVTVAHCPCCLKPMPTERNARMVADAVFPEKRDAEAE